MKHKYKSCCSGQSVFINFDFFFALILVLYTSESICITGSLANWHLLVLEEASRFDASEAFSICDPFVVYHACLRGLSLLIAKNLLRLLLAINMHLTFTALCFKLLRLQRLLSEP